MMTQQILFRGNVQGVWFRATTKRLAAKLPLAGYVRNLDDGRVELIVQGNDSDVKTLLHRIHAAYPNNIEAVEKEEIEMGEMHEFNIRQ